MMNDVRIRVLRHCCNSGNLVTVQGFWRYKDPRDTDPGQAGMTSRARMTLDKQGQAPWAGSLRRNDPRTNSQLSTLNFQLSTFNSQFSILHSPQVFPHAF